jgi:hypothetical protein
MKKILLLSLFFAFSNSVMAVPRVYLTCWYDTNPNQLGLDASASLSIYQGGTPPQLTLLAIRELRIQLASGGCVAVPIIASNGFARVGALQMTAVKTAGGDTISKQYTQGYTVGGKSFNLIFYIGQGLAPGYDYNFEARITWTSGAPSTINGNSTSSGIGLTLYCDYDFLQNSNRAGLDGAGWRPLTAYQDNTSYGWNVTADAYPDSTMDWDNSPHRVLARIFDSDWRSQTTPVWNIQWVDGFYGNHLISYLRGFLNSDAPVYSYDACTGIIQTVDTGGHPKETQLPGFVPAGGGQNQGAFMTQITPSPSTSASFSTHVYLNMGTTGGMRSIVLRWYYNDTDYSNPNYIAFGDSVPGALRGLLWGTGSTLWTYREPATLKCNSYGNGDSLCTMQELMAMEYYEWYGQFYCDFPINTGVYILKKNQGLLGSPNTTGGITFQGYVGLVGDSSYTKACSRGFVFPRAAIFTYGSGAKPWVYFCCAHEIGHTLGMQHQWSNCTYADTFHCPNGTIMSYSPSPVMNYGPDAKTWFNKAPDNWVQPVCGSGAMNNDRFVNGIHNYNLKVSDIIDW